MYDWYAGNLSSYNSYYPNDFLVWETLKWGREKGYTAFNFGGAGSPNKAYGVRDFKKKFGGKLIEHGYLVDTHFFLKPFIKYIIRNK